MRIQSKISINITFTNGKAQDVKSFLEKHPLITYGQIFLWGIEGIKTDEAITEDLKKKVKDLVK